MPDERERVKLALPGWLTVGIPDGHQTKVSDDSRRVRPEVESLMSWAEGVIVVCEWVIEMRKRL